MNAHPKAMDRTRSRLHRKALSATRIRQHRRSNGTMGERHEVKGFWTNVQIGTVKPMPLWRGTNQARNASRYDQKQRAAKQKVNYGVRVSAEGDIITGKVERIKTKFLRAAMSKGERQRERREMIARHANPMPETACHPGVGRSDICDDALAEEFV